MARYGRSTYRRKGRRGNRSLSTRRIFNSKSAKAQAGQIYALKKRLNRMYNSLKPEVKIVENQAPTEYSFIPGPGYSQFSSSFILPQTGTLDNQRVGSRIRLVKPTLFVSAKYTRMTPVGSGQTTSNAGNSGGALRIIAVQSKVPRNNVPNLQSLLHSDLSDSLYDINTIPNLSNPFEVGVTTEYHILYDKVFYFNTDKTILSKRINFKPKMRYADWNVANGDDETAYTYPAGEIYWFVVQGGLNAVGADLSVEDYDRISFSYTQKLAYTDV